MDSSRVKLEDYAKVTQEPSPEVKENLGTEWDQRGMARLGRKQELRRQFRFFGITGYAVILSCSWEFAMMSVLVLNRRKSAIRLC